MIFTGLRIFLLVTLFATSGANAGGIVASVAKAPITPDGDVAYQPTDYVINLDRSLDPDVDGRALLAGKTIKIIFPDDFINLGGPVLNPGGPPNCPPPAGTCSTGVLLQGWPQNPIPPSPANYTVGVEGTNTIVFTATRDLIAGDASLNGPGLKQIHLILRSFMNPNPGVYSALVEAETGPGGSLETGIARLFVVPNARASINVTSVFAGGAPTVYQDTTVGQSIPIDWNFLLWDNAGQPAVGVEIRQVNKKSAQLHIGNRVVGKVTIHAPAGARGQQVTSTGPSTLIIAPVLGLPTGRLTVNFVAGDTAGRYTIVLQMNNGTSVDMVVDVSD